MRGSHGAHLRALVAARTAGRGAAPVRGLLDALTSSYTRERRLVETIAADPPYQVVRGPAASGKLQRAAPDLGEHTSEVLDELRRRAEP